MSPPRGSSGCGPRPRRHHRDGRDDRGAAVERLSYLDTLASVRAFYLDLAEWALEDPARWGPWVAPCPISQEDLGRRKVHPPPQSPDGRPDPRAAARPAGLGPQPSTGGAASPGTAGAGPQTSPGKEFTAAGKTLTRIDRPHAAAGNVWARDPATGKPALPQPRGRARVLGVGGHRGAPPYRRPGRGTARAQPPQPGPVPAAQHRRAGAAAADRPIQDRYRAAARRQPGTRRRAQRGHLPGPRPRRSNPAGARPRQARARLASARAAAVPAPDRHREPHVTGNIVADLLDAALWPAPV